MVITVLLIDEVEVIGEDINQNQDLEQIQANRAFNKVLLINKKKRMLFSFMKITNYRTRVIFLQRLELYKQILISNIQLLNKLSLTKL